MLRSHKWFLRELERRERAWTDERAELIATICRLAAGKPLPPQPDRPPTEPEPRTWTPSPEQQPI